MKVTCLQENLHKGLQTVGKAVANKTRQQRARTGKARGRSDRKTGRIMARTPVASDRTMPTII